jgi:hypothetical protein
MWRIRDHPLEDWVFASGAFRIEERIGQINIVREITLTKSAPNGRA